MSSDFPELTESLLYSPLMQHIDEGLGEHIIKHREDDAGTEISKQPIDDEK